jgi:hypothetical protein
MHEHEKKHEHETHEQQKPGSQPGKPSEPQKGGTTHGQEQEKEHDEKQDQG